LERTDALTKKPLNFYKEEKTRKKETDRWLERHFGGSEWSLLTGSSLQTTTTATGAAAASSTVARQRQMGSMRPEINSRYFKGGKTVILNRSILKRNVKFERLDLKGW
jgi:hypothetical protein